MSPPAADLARGTGPSWTTSSRTKSGAPTSCSSIATDAPRGGLAGVAHRRAARRDRRRPAARRRPGCRRRAAAGGQLGVSRGVVVEAYQRLVDEGLLGGRRGAAARRCWPPRRARSPIRPTAGARTPVGPGRPVARGCPTCRRSRARPGCAPNARCWPARRRRARLRRPARHPRLRTELAGGWRRSRGVRAEPPRTSWWRGVAQALALLAQVLARRGATATVAVEDPGSRGHPRPARALGARARARPGGRRTVDVDALAGTGCARRAAHPRAPVPDRRRARARTAAGRSSTGRGRRPGRSRTTTTPSTATTGAPVRRARGARARAGRLRGQRLQDARARRCGWAGCVAPADAARRAGRAQAVVGHRQPGARPARCSPSSSPRASSSGTCAGSAPGSAPAATRCSTPCASTCPQARVHGVAAGLHLLVTLPEASDDVALAGRGGRGRRAVHPLSSHRIAPGPPGLVIGYAAQAPDRIREGIARLGAVSRSAGHRPRRG